MDIIKRLDHVSIGVEDIEKAKAFFHGIMGGVEMDDKGSSPGEGFDWSTFKLGDKKVELVTPHKLGEGGVGRYMATNGQGFHHLSMSVENLEEAIAHFESKGIRVIGVSDAKDSWKHCYLHPKDTFGALIQLFEETDETAELGD